jgi:hypothetical protein
MEKRGVSTEPFIYILTILIIAFVAIFGFRSFNDVKDTADFTSLSKFVNDLQNEVDRYSNFDIGSEKRVKISLPGEVEEICFVNKNEINQDIDDELKNIFEANEKDNMYVLPLDSFPAPAPDFKIDKLDISEEINPLCFETEGFLNAVIETKVRDNKIYIEIRK